MAEKHPDDSPGVQHIITYKNVYPKEVNPSAHVGLDTDENGLTCTCAPRCTTAEVDRFSFAGVTVVYLLTTITHR